MWAFLGKGKKIVIYVLMINDTVLSVKKYEYEQKRGQKCIYGMKRKMT